MSRRLALLLACAASLGAARARASAVTPPQAIAIYGDESVASSDDARALLVNPAAIGVRYPSELLIGFARRTSHREWNTLLGSWRRFGLVAARDRDTSRTYGLGFSLGSERLRFGWSHVLLLSGIPSKEADTDDLFGMQWRPSPWASGGFTVDHVFEPVFRGIRQSRLYTLGVGLRPLAWSRPAAFSLGHRLTLTGSVSVVDDGDWSQARVRVGAEFEAVPGLVVRATALDHGTVQVGVSLYGVRSSAHVVQDLQGGRSDYNAYAISAHAGEDRTAFASRADRRVADVRVGGQLADEALSGGVLGGGGDTPSAPVAHQLERALDDPLTRGVLLDLRGVSGMAQLEELRPRIERLRLAGKPVVAFMEEGGGRGDLYLASAADRVVASEPAEFFGLGLRVERRYYRRALASAGLRFERVSVGDYKSAFRNFAVDSTPPPDTVAIQHLLTQRQDLFVSAVSHGRPVTPERLETVLDGRQWPSATLAKLGVIDSVGWREDALAMLGRMTGLGPKPRTVNLAAVRSARRAWTVPRRIAVVYAGGSIVTGRSGGDLIEGATLGSATLIEQLDRAFHAPGIKAVVLRVESPGGSALASHLVDHTIERLRKETGRPLIVSMGSVAASGGYFISCHADRIFADRNTVTGSIGVLYGKLSFEGLYDKLHVREDDFERGAYMGGLSPARDWRPEDRAAADSTIRRLYRTFVERVADGRHMETAMVYLHAQGRAWLGEDAQQYGLVDAIGGLDAAIDEARRRGGVPKGEKIRLLELGHPRGGLLERLVSHWLSARWDEMTRLPDLDAAQARGDDALDALDQ